MTVSENNRPVAHYDSAIDGFQRGDILPLINDNNNPIPYADKTDIKVTIGDQPAQLNIEYEINNVHPDSVTLLVDVPPQTVVTIYRETVLDQQAEFPQNSKFQSEKMNEALDKICMQQQDQQEAIDRAIKMSNTLVDVSNPVIPDPAEGAVFIWEKDEDEETYHMENYPVVQEIEDFKETVDTEVAEIAAEVAQANTTADNALTTAQSAASDASAAVGTANAASVTANDAKTIAESAANNAVIAVNTAAQANNTANQAQETAVSADAKADSAVATANAADTKADQALTAADEANTKATQALTTANNADANATEALTTANIAIEDSNRALGTAGAASLNAEEALNTANLAYDTANAASTKVDEFEQDIEVVKEAAARIEEIQEVVEEASAAAAAATEAANNATEAAEGATEAATTAIGTAQSAETKADNALTTAQGVDGKATQAMSDAAQALSIANQAQEGVDYLDEKVREIELSKVPNVTLRGELTVSQGQVSGFSTVSYMQFPFVLDLTNTAFQIDFCFTTATDVQTQQNILDSYFGIALAIANGKGLMAISSNGTSWNIGSIAGTMDIQSNTTYYARLTWDGLQYKTFLSTDGVVYTQDMVLVGAVRPYPRTIFIGGCDQVETGHAPHPFLGTINMNKAYMYLNGQLYWQGMDDVGLDTRADLSLSNLDEVGEARFTAKQDALISGTNIKTINNESILGSGNFDVSSIEPLSQEEYDRRKEAGELEEGKYYSTPSDVSLEILSTLYPVGSLYITTNNTCPLQSLGIGTWILEATDRVLQGAGSRGAVGTTIDESLPNITGQIAGGPTRYTTTAPETIGAFSSSIVSTAKQGASGTAYRMYESITLNASDSCPTYQDGAPVQQNAYLINVYRRIS